MKTETIKFLTPIGGGLSSITMLTLKYVGNRIECYFGYNKPLIAEIKSMQGSKWHGFDDPNPRKIWSIADSDRNQFSLQYMRWAAMSPKEQAENPRANPYYKFKRPLIDYVPRRKLYNHQNRMVQWGISKHYCEWACEMGTGKSLAFIEVMEAAVPAFRNLQTEQHPDDKLVWYIGPKSGVKAVERELLKWGSTVKPRMITYEQLVKVVENWDSSEPVPFMLIADEASKIKTANAKRSQAVRHVADAIREEYGDMGFVILLTGTPAPKSPVDWWNQVETICPGYLKEGDPDKFKRRLCLIEQMEGLDGVKFPRVVTWFDSDDKCAKCGEPQAHPNHTILFEGLSDAEASSKQHRFVKAPNEVAKLYKRLENIVMVAFKKDCLDLPEKRYEIVRLKPTPVMMKAKEMIALRTTRAIDRLTLLRELSDGFQYDDTPDGTETCPNCHGTARVRERVPISPVDPDLPTDSVSEEQFVEEEMTCGYCTNGQRTKYKRTSIEIGTPKDDYFINDLDEHEETGRYIVWGGFTGSIDRLVKIAHQQGWATLRVDGRGYAGESHTGEAIDDGILLDAMDASHPNRKALEEQYPRLCFIGHPDAGGMALTLTASPTALFFSNSFKGEARMQSEDRGHRAGMDANRGYTIKDLLLLPSDDLVLQNLKKKKRLQDISLGELEAAEAER